MKFNLRCLFVFLLLICSGNLLAQGDLGKMSLEELLRIRVTTPSKLSTSIQDVASQIYVIDRQEIELYGWGNLAEIIGSVPEMATFSDRVYEFIMPRGYYQSNDPNSRILLLLDGHTIFEFFGYFNGHLPSVDVSQIDRVEIVMGPNSTIYGTNALFAIVNVITRKGQSASEKEISLELGSFQHTNLGISWRKKSGKNQINFHSSVGTRDVEDIYFSEYDSPLISNDGIIDGENNRLNNLTSYLHFQRKHIYVLGYFNYRKKWVPTGIYGGALNSKNTFFQDINSFIEIKGEYNSGNYLNGYVKVFADGYDFSGRYAYDPDSAFITGPPYSAEENKIKTFSIGAEWINRINWSPKQSTLVGMEYRNYHYLSFSYYSVNDPSKLVDEQLTEYPEKFHWFIFGNHRIQFTKKIQVETGLHLDYYHPYQWHLNPKISLHYNVNHKLQMVLNYAQAFRSANVWETNTKEPLFFVEGNDELEPEVLENNDIRIIWNASKKLRFSTNAYYYKLNNVIRQDGGKWINRGGLEGKGFSADVQYRDRKIHSLVGFSYVKTVHQGNSNQQIEFTPQWMIKARMAYMFQNHSSVSIDNQWIGSRYKGDKSKGKLPAYFLAGLTLRSSIVPGTWDINIHVHNIFDTKYQHPSFIPDLASFYNNVQHPVYDIPARGRMIVLRSTFTF